MTRWNPNPTTAAEVGEQVTAYYERTKAAMPKPVPLTPAEQAVWDAVEADRRAGVTPTVDWRTTSDDYTGQASTEYGEVWG